MPVISLVPVSRGRGEMVDTLVLEASASGVRVRVSPSAPYAPSFGENPTFLGSRVRLTVVQVSCLLSLMHVPFLSKRVFRDSLMAVG